MADPLFKENHRKAREILSALRQVIVGKEEELEIIIATIIAGGHVLIEGPPGVAKTLIAKSIAGVIGGTFRRVQGSPDILPTDLTGYHVYDLSGGSRFVRGPIFTNILMFDELNKTHPRAQSALLQAMMEYQVSVDGVTYDIERPFHVIATEIPEDIEVGVYPLTITLKDRFWARLTSYYVEPEEEFEVVKSADELYDLSRVELESVMEINEFTYLQGFLRDGVYVDDRVVKYIVDLVSGLRTDERVATGPSHRGGMYLYRVGKAVALIEGRDYVIPDDIKRIAKYVLSHRMIIREEYRGEYRAEDIVDEYLRKVPVPKE